MQPHLPYCLTLRADIRAATYPLGPRFGRRASTRSEPMNGSPDGGGVARGRRTTTKPGRDIAEVDSVDPIGEPSSRMSPAELEAKLLDAFPDARISIEDLTGGEDHYRVRIASQAFAGQPRIKQHRLVYAALGAQVGGAIHALALETCTPDAW